MTIPVSTIGTVEWLRKFVLREISRNPAKFCESCQTFSDISLSFPAQISLITIPIDNVPVQYGYTVKVGQYCVYHVIEQK
jgi:hypothetical protein